MKHTPTLKENVHQYMMGDHEMSVRSFYDCLSNIVDIEDYKVRDHDISLSIGNESRKDYYPYIPLNPTYFMDCIKSLQLLFGHRESFIDVGCGIGEKVLLAHYIGMFDRCYGIEYSSYTFDIAKDKIEPIVGTNSFIYGDAFAHDFSKYDTIYMYCPISNSDTMLRLLEYIYKTMRDDAIILFFNGSIYDIRQAFSDRHIQYLYDCNSYWLYKKPLPFFPNQMET